MAVLSETLAAVELEIDGLSPADTRRPEAAGKWSIAAVLRHLADTELVYAWRYRVVLGHEGPEPPTLTGFDQDAWAVRFGYERTDVRQAVADLRAVRDLNLRLLRAATPADLERVGLHAERGRESVRHITRMHAGHDLAHRRQIARIRAAFG